MTDVRNSPPAVAQAVEAPESAGRSSGRPGDQSERLHRMLWSAGFLVLALVAWQAGSSLEWWSQANLPAPTRVLAALLDIVGTAQFRADLWRTVSSVGLSLLAGITLGALLGILFWKAPTVGRAFEPFLVSFYAVPLVVFYPMMLVIIGINQWPIVILATLMAAIPMALNTWVGFAAIPDVYLRLAATLECTRRQTLFRLAIPAAAPLVFAGIRLAASYALIGVVAMEFVVAADGLGFRIRYLYELFQQPGMMAYIVVVFVLSGLLTGLVTAAERRVTAHRESAGGGSR